MGGQIIEKDQYVGRMNGFLMEPEKVFIVGIDVPPGADEPAGPRDPGYDSRVTLPVDVALGLSLIQEGNLQPIQCRKNGTLLEVAYGRQRTRSARWANEQIALHWGEIDGEVKAGTCVLPEHLRSTLERDTKVVIKVEIVRADDKRMIAAMVAENAHRRGDDTVVMAQKLGTYLDRGHTWAQAKVTFGIKTDRDLSALLKVLDLGESVQQLITSRSMSLGAAGLLAELSRDQQVNVVESLKVAGKRLSPRNLRVAIDALLGKVPAEPTASPNSTPSARTDLADHFGMLERLHTLLETDAGADDSDFEAPAEDILLLKWVVGRATAHEVRKHIPWLAKALAKV